MFGVDVGFEILFASNTVSDVIVGADFVCLVSDTFYIIRLHFTFTYCFVHCMFIFMFFNWN